MASQGNSIDTIKWFTAHKKE